MFIKRLIKMNIVNTLRRKYKHCVVLIICCVAISYYIFVRNSESDIVKQFHSVPVNYKINLQYVTVHLDLKGSPPKMNYLLSLLPTLKFYGTNSILLEYEDMFPFEGSIVNLSATYHYTRDELTTFINRAKDYDMEIIPLVQTFGHMEYALKLKEFAHLRENPHHPAAICPSNNLSTVLITNMLTQVIELHTTIMPLRHIHIGCDEVYNLNECPLCTTRFLKKDVLFMEHVQKVSEIVEKLSPDTKVLIWPDVILSNKKPKKYISFDNIEPVWWDYTPDTRWLSHTVAYNLHAQFSNIWIASAFKGADGLMATIPDIKQRFLNNMEWMKFIFNYSFGGENKVFNFKGIILTGWSRYAHMFVQCELLPVAMPSLLLNLMLIKKLRGGIQDNLHQINTCEFFNKYLKTDFENIFQTLPSNDPQCTFEKTKLYNEFHNVFNFASIDNCLNDLRTTEMFSLSNEPIDLHNLKRNTFRRCDSALKRLKKLNFKLISFMNRYYRTEVINSYINERINAPEAEIGRLMKLLNSKHNKIKYWKRRQ